VERVVPILHRHRGAGPLGVQPPFIRPRTEGGHVGEQVRYEVGVQQQHHVPAVVVWPIERTPFHPRHRRLRTRVPFGQERRRDQDSNISGHEARAAPVRLAWGPEGRSARPTSPPLDNASRRTCTRASSARPVARWSPRPCAPSLGKRGIERSASAPPRGGCQRRWVRSCEPFLRANPFPTRIPRALRAALRGPTEAPSTQSERF
jgi:hypothetical protein